MPAQLTQPPSLPQSPISPPPSEVLPSISTQAFHPSWHIPAGAPGGPAARRVGAVAPSAAGHCGTHPPTRASQPDKRPSSGVFPILYLSFSPVPSPLDSQIPPTPYSTRIRRNWVSTGFKATRVETGPTNRATSDQSPSETDDSSRQAVVGAQSIARTHSPFSIR